MQVWCKFSLLANVTCTFFCKADITFIVLAFQVYSGPPQKSLGKEPSIREGHRREIFTVLASSCLSCYTAASHMTHCLLHQTVTQLQCYLDRENISKGAELEDLIILNQI